MNTSPPIDAFLACLRNSNLVDPIILDPFLAQLHSDEGMPTEPTLLARKLLSSGIVTKFQAEQVLLGRTKKLILAGKYKILERISSGPMSTVYLCEHMVMKRLVALKMLPTGLAKDPAIIARFHREARAAARLRHPNVVAIYDVDSANGMTFLVAEYVDGNDLGQIVAASGPMSIGRAAECIRQAAEGLQHAHENGMVHRDIKPGNLLLDRSGTIKLLDLGLVRLFADESDGMTRHNDCRLLLGTIDYLSPEQAQDSHEVDIRTDIYSLGATAYFLLSGRTLFESASIAQKLTMHFRRSPEPILRGLPGLPRDFAEVLARMVAKDPNDRYQTPAEVAQAMAPWTSEGISPPSTAEMPKLCVATRKAVEQSRIKSPRTPSRRLASTPKLVSKPAIPPESTSFEGDVLIRSRSSRPTLVKAVGSVAVGLVALTLILFARSPWKGTSSEVKAAQVAAPRPEAPSGSTTTPSPIRDVSNPNADSRPQPPASPEGTAELLARARAK